MKEGEGKGRANRLKKQVEVDKDRERAGWRGGCSEEGIIAEWSRRGEWMGEGRGKR